MRLLLRIDRELLVAREENGRRIIGAALNEESIIVEGADAAAGDDLVVEALVHRCLLDGLVLRVVPARRGRVRPMQQAHHPGKLENARGAQLHIGAGVLGLVARTPRTPRGHLADADDDDLLIKTGLDLVPLESICEDGSHKVRQGGECRLRILRRGS